MTVAVAADVAARIGRPLTTFETARVTAFLEDCEVEIMRLGPTRLTDPAWIPAVKSVECSVVIRAARLPDSLGTVVPAIENAGFASAPAVQGAIYLRREERRRLGLPLSGAVNMSPQPVKIFGFPDWWNSPEDDGDFGPFGEWSIWSEW